MPHHRRGRGPDPGGQQAGPILDTCIYLDIIRARIVASRDLCSRVRLLALLTRFPSM